MLGQHTPDNVVEVHYFCDFPSSDRISSDDVGDADRHCMYCSAFAIRRFLFIPFHHEGDDGAVVEEELSE